MRAEPKQLHAWRRKDVKTNVQLQQDVIDELQYEPSIEAAGIGVTAKDGIITLTGTVKSYSEKSSATQATERVSGVKAVVDEIKVELPYMHERGDEDIAKATLQALEWNTLKGRPFIMRLQQLSVSF
jgi:hypothetical protein